MSSQARPYGKQEIDQDVPRGLQGADDSLAYVKKKNVAVIGPGQDLKDNIKEEPEQEEMDKKYQKVDWKKRHDDLKRHHDNKLNGMKQEIEELKDQILNNRPKFTPPKTPEELATFRAENPDIYDVVESVAHLRASEETEQLKSTVAKLTEKLQDEEATRAFAELKMAVPDFEEIRNSSDFHQWAETQPPEIQAWIYKNKTNAGLAAKAINLYKVDRGMQNKQPQRNQIPQQSAADIVRTARTVEEPQDKGGRVFTTSEIGNMSWKQYEAMREEIDQAHREGRVVRG